jgi:hypothetical protein
LCLDRISKELERAKTMEERIKSAMAGADIWIDEDDEIAITVEEPKSNKNKFIFVGLSVVVIGTASYLVVKKWR